MTPMHHDDNAARGRAGSRRRSAGGDAEFHLLDYVRVLYRRRWAALSAFLLVFLSVTVYTFTSKRVYGAKVQILIEKESSTVVEFKEAVEQNQIADDYYQTQYKILQSRALVRRTLDSLDLWSHPQFTPAEGDSTLGRIVDAVTPWGSDASSPEPATNESATQSAAIDRFLRDLTVSPVRNSRLVDVRFTSTDPALSARVANAVAQAYISQNQASKSQSSQEASEWLDSQLAEQRKQVETSEQALQQYRERTDSVSLEDKQNIVVQKLADLNAAVTRAKTERIQKEALYNQIQGLQQDRRALDTFPAILGNSFIQQQKAVIADLQQQQAQQSEKLGPRHPDMLKIANAISQAELKLQAEVSNVVQAVRNEFEAARGQEQTLAAALEAQKRDALDLTRKGIDYSALQRDAATNRQIFESLLQRSKETGVRGDLKTNNIRIVDAAEVPRRPLSPNVPVNLALAFFGGALFAIGMVFLFEYMDNRIKTPDDIRNGLGVPFFGMVPALFGAAAQDPLIGEGAPSNFDEAFRAIRTNVLFSSADEGCRSLVVTSSSPGEGKTTVASNLAVTLAQANQRVLLMDADMRKPRVHAVFKKNRRPGLSDLLVGKTTLAESVRPTSMAGLWVLPAGVLPPNPAELLASKRFAELLRELSDRFDCIVIDTPPVMAVTDSAIAANVASGVVFVVGAEKVGLPQAEYSLEQLTAGKGTIVGAILNMADVQNHGYYYGPYTRDDYGERYQPAQEKAS